MVAEQQADEFQKTDGCSLAKISMVAELVCHLMMIHVCCSLAKISMVAELYCALYCIWIGCSLAKISMVAEPQNI